MTTHKYFQLFRNGKTYWFWQVRLKDEFPYAEGRANPLLWFSRDDCDILCTGAVTQGEALRLTERAVAELMETK